MRKMKDSGIEWIGEIPSDWDVTRIGYESWIRARLGWKGLKAEEYVDEGFAFLSAFNIVDDKLQWENLNFINQQRYDESPEIKLKKGDILLVKDGAGIGKCARIDSLPIGAATTNGSLAVISTHAKLSYRYLYFYLLSPIFQNYIYRLMNGMGVPHLSQEELRRIQIPFPPIDEQQKIADFLDEKCGEIDSIRSDIQKQIDILNDYKKSVITEAVTKGLNPKSKMKDSGIEWIGKIPEYWSVKRNKYIMRKQKIVKAKYENEDILSLTMNGVVVRDLENLTGKRPASFDGYQIVYPNNLLMCLFDIDVTPRCVGLIKNYGLTSPAYSQFVMQDFAYAPYYYYYYLNIDMTKELLHLAKNLRHSLTEDDLGAISTVLPPISEQKAISSYLDEKCSEIDATIAEKHKQLETLEEYKKSLIFEYVTGKKEVPA